MANSILPETSSSDYDVIFVKAYRHKNGKLMVAANYGLKAFALRVRKKK
ncbi:hypothetical protein [Bilophila wadsworthia]|nr:hypothetical protein [Bilophila wadsworthia]